MYERLRGEPNSLEIEDDHATRCKLRPDYFVSHPCGLFNVLSGFSDPNRSNTVYLRDFFYEVERQLRRVIPRLGGQLPARAQKGIEFGNTVSTPAVAPRMSLANLFAAGPIVLSGFPKDLTDLALVIPPDIGDHFS